MCGGRFDELKGTDVTDTAAGDDSQRSQLEDALQDANFPTLLLVLAHLTGDATWLEPPYRPAKGRPLDDNDTAGLPEEVLAHVRAAALEVITSQWEAKAVPSEPTDEQIAERLGIALVEDVPTEYGPLLAEEMGLRSREVNTAAAPPGYEVVIIGTGFSGLCAGIKLRNAGIPFRILEKNPWVGGTWLENAYPGCGVDTPIHLYSFSFAQNPEWSRYFAKRDDVFSYLEWLVDEYQLRESIEFNTEVVHAEYMESASRWRVRAESGASRYDIDADVLISAVGMVNRPSVPDIPGLESFNGPVMHTAEWDNDVDLEGKKVAVVGTGASAMQLVPSIADTADRVVVFQRSKQWAVPHPNYQRGVSGRVKFLMRHVPYYEAWYRLRAFWNFGDRLHPTLQIDPDWPHQERSINAANDRHREFLTKYIKSELGDRTDLVDACVPEYPPYGKRPLIDNGWFRTITRDDVDLVTERVSAAKQDRVVSGSGEEYECDVVALATGFKTLQFLWPIDVYGRDGRNLREFWGNDDARAYLGITVPGFPNFFILNGPNTNAGHGGSAVIATELQVRYVMQAIGYLLERRARTVEVREDMFWDYNKQLDDAMSNCIWVHPGMTTYYRNEAGRVVVTSPWKYIDYWSRTRQFAPDDYHLEPDPSEG